jgi:2-dehydro-3-deoxyphosphooctonate aldolase (KDO 8-P synthase)
MAENNKTELSSLYKELTTKPFIIAGPCVAESRQLLDEVAAMLVELQKKYKLPFIFKASFDKANRTSVDSFRGPGLRKGLEELAYVKEKYNLPVTSDIHESWQAEQAGKVLDIIQIPAFLCRQTDLLIAAAETGTIP